MKSSEGSADLSLENRDGLQLLLLLEHLLLHLVDLALFDGQRLFRRGQTLLQTLHQLLLHQLGLQIQTRSDEQTFRLNSFKSDLLLSSSSPLSARCSLQTAWCRHPSAEPGWSCRGGSKRLFIFFNYYFTPLLIFRRVGRPLTSPHQPFSARSDSEPGRCPAAASAARSPSARPAGPPAEPSGSIRPAPPPDICSTPRNKQNK